MIQMASVMSGDPPDSRSRIRRKRKKKSVSSSHQNSTETMMTQSSRWRSASEQQRYSSKLLQALRTTPRRGRAIRNAADRALAVGAKGRSRWSRAILTNRLKLKCRFKGKRNKPKPNKLPVGMRASALWISKAKNVLAVQKKARVLGNLVPGCRKQPLPVVLEEAHDYISALDMQVRAMTALTELLSVAGALSTSPS